MFSKKYVLGIYFKHFIQQFLTVRDFQVGLKWFSQESFNNLILAQKADPVSKDHAYYVILKVCIAAAHFRLMFPFYNAREGNSLMHFNV